MEKIKKIKELFNTALSSDKFWAAAILLAVWGAFAPSLNFKELIGDDFFYYNHLLTLEKNIWNIFDPVLGLRTPLTSLSLYADFLLWGKKGFVTGAHFINILLHCGTGILFYVLLRSLKWGDERLTPAWAGMAALIFALHPQRVESVAWLCERKDCLAMFLGLGAFLFFLYDMRKEKISWSAAILLILSCLAKPMWLFFFVPAAALLWSERRTFQRQLFLKLLSLPIMIFAVFTAFYFFESLPFANNPGMSVPLLFKAETVLHNYGNYFVRTFLPGNLFPLYPYYDPTFDPRWMAFVPIILCFVPFFGRQQEFRPAIIYGVIPLLVCFAVMLLPVVGFNRVGNTDFADRYSYLPALFLITGAAFLLKLNIPISSAFGRWFPVMGLLYCGGLFYKTVQYLPVWESNQSVIERCIALKAPNFNSAVSAAVIHFRKGEFDKARKLCEEKLLESSRYPADFNNIIRVFKLSLEGLIHFRQGAPEKGITYLNTIYSSEYSGMVRHFPIDFAQEVFTKGAEYHLKRYGNKKAAANLYLRCSQFFKNHSAVYGSFYAGMSALTEGNYAEAVKNFQYACELDPHDPRCVQNLRYAENKLKEQKK